MEFDLRTRCSNHFTFAAFIECGETWRARRDQGIPTANLPFRSETLEGIMNLAQRILDPVYDEFGPLVLTYGFAGPALVKHIKGKISPPLDQHAGSEFNGRGKLICGRQGQACDLRVPGADACLIAEWIRGQLPFDRLYIYGAANALHVSYGPERAGKVYAMVKGENGRVPRDVTKRSWGDIAQMLGHP